LLGAPPFLFMGERMTTSDRDILKGFMAGEGAACAELLVRLRPAVLLELRRHHSGLRHAHDEILDAAETRLFEWRKQTLKGEGQIDVNEAIQWLGQRLAKQEARAEERYEERNPLATKKEIKEQAKRKERSRLTTDERVDLGDLEREIEGLPEELGLALMAEAQRVLAGGEPLDVQLGLTPEAARKRLERARKALKERLVERDEDSNGET
jgi:hypothetical protein